MGLHGILPPGLGKNRAKLRKDIKEYHTTYAINFNNTDIDTFIARRPDGLAFDKKEKLCVLLEYTRAMDTNEDWAEKKEQEKDDRNISLLGYSWANLMNTMPHKLHPQGSIVNCLGTPRSGNRPTPGQGPA